MLVLGLASRTASARDVDPAAQGRLVEVAHAPAWLRLLHYRETASGGYASEIEGSGFFLSPRGKEDPVLELTATIDAMAMPITPGHEDEHAACRFPARRRVVEEAFPSDLPARAFRCPALTRYEAATDVGGIAVVYAASYLSNPASAFGHTFLRLRRRPSSDERDLAIDFVARTDTNNPVLYAFKGLTGMFPGHYAMKTYREKVREYDEVQGRDLWEYDLALTPEELKRVVLHLYELSGTHIDYFYLTKNCSYAVLAAIEAGAPRVDVLSDAKAIVLPKDTLKALYAVEGLVNGVRALPSTRRRSGSGADATVPSGEAPHEGHDSMRATLGAGVTSQYRDGYLTLGFRLTLHDLADPPQGDRELTQLQFMDTHLRYDPDRSVVTLDALTFAELTSLRPLSRTEHALSWRVRAFGVRLHDADCPDGFAHGLDGSVGATLATKDERFALFFLADGYAAFSGSLDGIDGSFVRVGLGPYAGLRVHLPGQTVALLTGTASYLPGERLHATYDVRATVRTALGRDLALGLEGAKMPLATEVQVSSYLYF